MDKTTQDSTSYMEKTLIDLIYLMSDHDYNAAKSDDQREWLKNISEKKQIIRLIQKLDEPIQKSVLKFVPKHMREQWQLDLKTWRFLNND